MEATRGEGERKALHAAAARCNSGRHREEFEGGSTHVTSAPENPARFNCVAFGVGGGWARTLVVKDDSHLWLGARVTFIYNDHIAPQVRVVKPLKKELRPTVEVGVWATF